MLKSVDSSSTQKPERVVGDETRPMDLRFLVYLAGTGATEIHPLGRAATAALIEKLQLRPGLRVLDVGCGTGGTMARLAQYNLARIDGVDVTPAMLRVARKRIRLAGLGKRSGVSLVEPGGPLPFADSAYDRVYTESVLGFQDAGGAKALLKEIYRVLKPGGRYVANEAIWRSEVPAETIAAINAACLADFGLRMASDSPWALDDWLGVMKEAGFHVVSSDLISLTPGGRTQTRSRLGLRALASNALTRLYWLSSNITSAGRLSRARYRRLNEQHHDDGKYIEPRLFVLERPHSSTASSDELSV